MTNKILQITLCSMLALGAAVAAPVAQDQTATPAPAAQQGEHHHQADPNKQLQMMTKRLNLTADQQNQLLPILTDRQQQVAAIQSDNTLAKKDRWEKMKSVREDSRTKIEAILTPEQKQTFEQMQQRQQERRAAEKQ